MPMGGIISIKFQKDAKYPQPYAINYLNSLAKKYVAKIKITIIKGKSTAGV